MQQLLFLFLSLLAFTKINAVDVIRINQLGYIPNSVKVAAYIMNYMRQQRCGYNPFLQDSCHLHDGIIVDHPTKTGEKIDVTGGWHDATDYLQYSTTSVNAIFQMMFAYQNFPEVYCDEHKANGDEGKIRKEQKENYQKVKAGAIVRINPDKKNIYLVFTADSLFEGGEQIFDQLKMHQIKASFFFTGNFLQKRNHKRIIRKIIEAGHYVGPHSDSHLLYCDWKNRDSTLVSYQ